jgi:hypothetical protein
MHVTIVKAAMIATRLWRRTERLTGVFDLMPGRQHIG